MGDARSRVNTKACLRIFLFTVSIVHETNGKSKKVVLLCKIENYPFNLKKFSQTRPRS